MWKRFLNQNNFFLFKTNDQDFQLSTKLISGSGRWRGHHSDWRWRTSCRLRRRSQNDETGSQNHCTFLRLYVSPFECLYIGVCVFGHLLVWVFACLCVFQFALLYICPCVRLYACTFVHLYVCSFHSCTISSILLVTKLSFIFKLCDAHN